MKRTALITGASAGLGAEFARQLAARGVDLLLVARREEKLHELAAELSQAHDTKVHVFAADLANRDTPAAIERFTSEEGIAVDWLINNAGIAGPDLLENRDWKEQANFLELMMISVTQMCHRFIPAMESRGFGRVINVSSFAGRIPRRAGANYGPAKAYLVALSEELALCVKGTGVHVTALCPGFTHTDFHETAGLMAMKRSLPSLLWYNAQTVASEGIAAVEKGRPVYASGRIYRWLDPFAQSVWTRRLIKAFAPGR